MLTLETLVERWPLKAPQTAAAGVVAVTVLLLGWQNWQWWGPGAEQSAGPSDTAPIIAAQPDNSLPVLLSANLFGNAPANAAAPLAQAVIPASTLGFTLRAAFAATGSAPGGAIIESTDGTAHWYGLNDTVPGGGTVHEIHPDHVVLNRNGSLERLDFPPMASSMQAVASSPDGGVGGGTVVTSPAGVAQPIPADMPAEDKARLIRQRLEELRNRSRT